MFSLPILFQPNSANLQPVTSLISRREGTHEKDRLQHSLLPIDRNLHYLWGLRRIATSIATYQPQPTIFMRSSTDLLKWLRLKIFMIFGHNEFGIILFDIKLRCTRGWMSLEEVSYHIRLVKISWLQGLRNKSRAMATMRKFIVLFEKKSL